MAQPTGRSHVPIQSQAFGTSTPTQAPRPNQATENKTKSLLTPDRINRPLPKPPKKEGVEQKSLAERSIPLTTSAKNTAENVKNLGIRFLSTIKEKMNELPEKVKEFETKRKQNKEEKVQEQMQTELLKSKAKRDLQELQSEENPIKRIDKFNELTKSVGFSEIQSNLEGLDKEKRNINKLRDEHVLPLAKSELHSIRQGIELYRKEPTKEHADKLIERFNTFAKDLNTQSFAERDVLDGWNYVKSWIDEIKKSI